MSRYDARDTYCYPGSSVLRNTAGLTDQASLDAFEADITAARLLELSQHPPAGTFDLEHLRKIHRAIFRDVYDWAGELRTVDISRGENRFANVRQITPYAQSVFAALAKERFLRGLQPSKFSVRLAHYLSEINALHPFREGNGRVQRAFAAQLAAQAGYAIDYDGLSQEEMYSAMAAAFTGDEQPLTLLLRNRIARL